MAYYLRHAETGKEFRVLSRDKEAGTVKLKGKLGEFDEAFNPDVFKKQGYDLITKKDDE